MLSSAFRRSSLTTFSKLQATRALATGPASGGEISDDLLAKLGNLSTQAHVDGLWVMGWPNAQIDGSRALHPSHKCVGRAVTLQFVPARPDIAADKPPGGESPEYEAFEKCGPNEVSVCLHSMNSSRKELSVLFNDLLFFNRFLLWPQLESGIL